MPLELELLPPDEDAPAPFEPPVPPTLGLFDGSAPLPLGVEPLMLLDVDAPAAFELPVLPTLGLFPGSAPLPLGVEPLMLLDVDAPAACEPTLLPPPVPEGDALVLPPLVPLPVPEGDAPVLLCAPPVAGQTISAALKPAAAARKRDLPLRSFLFIVVPAVQFEYHHVFAIASTPSRKSAVESGGALKRSLLSDLLNRWNASFPLSRWNGSFPFLCGLRLVGFARRGLFLVGRWSALVGALYCSGLVRPVLMLRGHKPAR